MDKPSSGIDAFAPDAYLAEVKKLLASENFDELDRIANSARAKKSRFPGGGWKLRTFYLSLCGECDDSSEADLIANIDHLKKWVAKKPESITARVALTAAYISYAWYARGVEFADLVQDDAWKIFHERLELASATVTDALRLKDTCPEVFVVMQQLGRAMGVPLNQLTAIAEKGASIEPLYYYIYQEQAFSLEPRWFGEEGDSEKYAKEVADRIGGKEGDAVYFHLAAHMNCMGCSESKDAFERMSWIRIKNGYAANQELYGTSKIQLNEFAHLAARANDHAAALKVFLEIGDNYDKDTWRKRRTFESYKQWAIAPSEEFMQKWQASANEMQAPGGAQYFQQTERDLMQKNDSVVKQCMELFRDDKQQFQVALKLDSHGDAQEVSVWPPTRISSCVLPKLVKHVTAPPPKPTFWVILTFLNSVPTMQSKEGPPLPESGF